MLNSNQGQPAHGALHRAVRRKLRSLYAIWRQRIARPPAQGHDAAPTIEWRREYWILGGTAVLLILISAVVIPGWARAMGIPAHMPHTVSTLPLPALPNDTASVTAPTSPTAGRWRAVSVQAGQTLSDIFQSEGLGFSDLERVLDATKNADALRTIHPGDRFAFQLDPQGKFQALRFDIDDAHRVLLRLDNHGDIDRQMVTRDIEHRQAVAHGVIKSSLFGAAIKAGISEGMVVELADVFKFDIDFIKDVRSGDRFTVVYDEVYRDGQRLRDGHIMAAEFYNQGKRYTAYRFKKADGSIGYYDEDGRPLQKALLRTPVKFTRISSRFSLSRKHPILGYTRAHKGVDYAAPTGTPIHAAGNGVITFRGWAHGFGRFITIRHSSKYTTAYGHMSRFAKGLHAGSHVHQGQVIGYVGMSGLATGPHLHYEVRVFGHQRNPLTVTMPKPRPLPSVQLAVFKRRVAPMLARILTVDANVKLAHIADASSGADAVN